MSEQIELAANLADLRPGKQAWKAYARLRTRVELKTKQGKPYVNLELEDLGTVVEGKVWSNSAAFEPVHEIDLGTDVAVLCIVDEYQGKPQLKIEQIRPVKADDPGYDPAKIEDPIAKRVRHLCCEALVFDIETVPAHDARKLPATVAASLAKNAEHKDMEQAAVMGMSPFFGKVVSLALGEGDAPIAEQKVTALIVPPEGCDESALPEWMVPMSEADLLRAFWFLASKAQVVVTYNGRGFDVPFLATRSLIHGVPARVDLLSNRWSLRPHLDLFDIMGQRGRGPSNLDTVCWALGIESPKESMDGSMVAPAYQAGKIEEIAHYNRHDVRATTEVYQRVRDGLLRYRKDW